MEENEKLYKIRAEVEKAKQEKQQAERLLVRAENRLKYRENMSRKARKHRLIVLGAVMEQYFYRTEGVIGSTARSDDGASGYQ